MFITECVELLKQSHVACDVGLSSDEIRSAEETFGFEFSPDHRDFLAAVQPAGDRWWNWRTDSAEKLRSGLDWPRNGVLFDVENSDFWPESWGVRPDLVADRLDTAAAHIKLWPALVPLYGHRYMPAAPAGTGAPVFSVYQTDVIFYGHDLYDYLRRELKVADLDDTLGQNDPTVCPPWSLLAFGRDQEL